MPPKPGRVISSTPPKPTQIADQRRQPIHSPSNGPEAMATMNGKVKMIDSDLVELQPAQRQEIAARSQRTTAGSG